MCNPLLFNCSASHFPLLIDSAMERLHDSLGEEVHLSKSAQDVLYQHGNRHKQEFETALHSRNQAELDRLSNELQKRLKAALDDSSKIDKNGRTYNPRRIDEEGMKKALNDDPWVP